MASREWGMRGIAGRAGESQDRPTEMGNFNRKVERKAMEKTVPVLVSQFTSLSSEESKNINNISRNISYKMRPRIRNALFCTKCSPLRPLIPLRKITAQRPPSSPDVLLIILTCVKQLFFIFGRILSSFLVFRGQFGEWKGSLVEPRQFHLGLLRPPRSFFPPFVPYFHLIYILSLYL